MMLFRGDRLREAREAMREHGRSVSQERFAELIHVSRRSPLRWENGQSEPRSAQLDKIVEVTGRPVEFFFDGAAAPSQTVDDIGGLADALRMVADLLDTRASRLTLEEVA